MDSTTFMIGTATAATPWLVALMRKRHWSEDRVVVVAVMLAVVAFVLGYTLDGKPYMLPMPGEFWLGLMASYGGQQIAYRGFRRFAPNALVKVEEL